ncbi:hypothetical protein AZ09_11515 [Acetobacter aceti 1023]|nr:hypothetical protein AZ09_11515 [Acetobacter aceti 1023]
MSIHPEVNVRDPARPEGHPMRHEPAVGNDLVDHPQPILAVPIPHHEKYDLPGPERAAIP